MIDEKKLEHEFHSSNMTPIIENFSLKTTLPDQLLDTLRNYCERRAIRDPATTIANLFPGDADPSYNGFMAELLAYASTWAYADPATFAFVMAQRGLMNWRFYYMRLTNDPLFVVASAYLMQSESGDVAILVFRGTEPTNAINWLTDVTIRPERFLEGEVHGGIVRNLRAIWPLVSLGLHNVGRGQSLEFKAKQPNRVALTQSTGFEQDAPEDTDALRTSSSLKAMYIAGHSLGGAMAALSSAYIWQNPDWHAVRDHFHGCYTYGAPMVSSPALARSLNQSVGKLVYRHVYANDVVPRLPPWTTGPFEHFGREYRCRTNEEGWLLQESACDQWRHVSTLGLAALPIVLSQFPELYAISKKIPISMDDHSPRNYVRISERSRTQQF